MKSDRDEKGRPRTVHHHTKEGPVYADELQTPAEPVSGLEMSAAAPAPGTREAKIADVKKALQAAGHGEAAAQSMAEKAVSAAE